MAEVDTKGVVFHAAECSALKGEAWAGPQGRTLTPSKNSKKVNQSRLYFKNWPKKMK